MELCLLLGATLTGLAYIRTVPVFAIAVAPLAAAELQRLFPGKSHATFRMHRVDKMLGLALVTAFVAVTAWWVPQVPEIEQGAPWKASAALNALPGRARVLNDYTLGGWMLWTARDASPVVDGRTEIYSPEHVRRTLAAMELKPGWKRYVTDSQVDAAWLYKASPIRFGLQTMGWRTIFRDDFSVVMVPPE